MAGFPVIVAPVPQTMKFSEAQRRQEFGMEGIAANKILEEHIQSLVQGTITELIN